MEITFDYNIPINESGRRKEELMIYGLYTSGKELYLRTADEDGASDILLDDLLNGETAIEVDAERALCIEIKMKEDELMKLKLETEKTARKLRDEIAQLQLSGNIEKKETLI